MVPDSEGFNYPRVNADLCVDCHACERVCPQLNPITNDRNTAVAYQAAANDVDVKLRSSSGGVFSLIAQEVLQHGGVVCGAAFNDDYSLVKHICIEHMEQLDSLRRSKYVQSQIGDCYQHIKSYLSQKRKVMFVGTPCQVAGLTRFLGRDYENLLKVEVVCHGVPSPKVWREYLKRCVKGATVLDVNFRDKTRGWDNYALSITTDRGVCRRQRYEDQYLALFVNNVINRPSCSTCAFSSQRSAADLTLGDCWDRDKFDTEWTDDEYYGLSIVYSRTDCGEVSIRSAADGIRQVSLGKTEPAYFNGSEAADCRERFFQDFNQVPSQAIRSYSKRYSLPAITLIKMKIAALFGRK